jgi:hypothetical protein
VAGVLKTEQYVAQIVVDIGAFHIFAAAWRVATALRRMSAQAM